MAAKLRAAVGNLFLIILNKNYRGHPGVSTPQDKIPAKKLIMMEAKGLDLMIVFTTQCMDCLMLISTFKAREES